ncbi:MAG: type II toxin-antitoxin system RelB/DinJ family antitoxin [Coriobacteriales bacterium]|jgi:RHH-type rel operon transcriptional repressor/antitoxin RelB|nr:type II toxin-antitoxin system RelB/DinJ family antitoxin [Coriobacteriales bacterium]
MSSILTVRLDDDIKRSGTEVLLRHGLSPSAAIQKLFAYVVKNDELPFTERARPSNDEIERLVAVLDSFHSKKPSGMTDEELKDARMRDRYGSRS